MNALLLLAALAPEGRAAPGRGDLVIVEVMAAPKGDASNCEWIEVANTTGAAVSLDGCLLLEGEVTSTGFQLQEDADLSGITVPASATAGAPAVLARDTASCRASGASTVDCVAWDAPPDSGGTCIAEPVGTYAGIGINNSGEREICIACGGATSCDDASGVVDEVRLDWSADFASGCDTSTYPGGCSANLSLDAVDPDANDDLRNWTVPDADSAPETWDVAGQRTLTTAGGPSATPEVLPACSAGDLAITEIMASPKSDPQSNASHEWFELLGTGADCALQGCWLVQLDADGRVVDGEFADGDLVDGKAVQVDAPLAVHPGERLLLTHGYEPVAVSGPDGQEVPSDYAYDYSNYWMSPEPGMRLAVYCGGDGTSDAAGEPTPEELFGELVDAAPLYVEHLKDWCPDGGCSVNVPEEDEDPVSNDDPGNWCIPPLDGVWQDEEATFVGTPGQPGDCQVYDWPEAGQLVFTEFMPDPAGTADWFEMHELAGEPVELNWCVLRRFRLEEPDTGGEAVRTDVQENVFASREGGTYPVEAGAWQVFSQDACLPWSGGGADTGGEVPEVCPGGEYVYDRGDLTASHREYLELECGGVVVDVASVDAEAQGLRDGHSAMFDPDAGGDDWAAANDDPDNWCEAAFTQPCFEAGEGLCNYGTPGAENACLVEHPVIEGRPGCLCSAAPGGGRSSGPAGALGALLAAALGAVRRRRGGGAPRRGGPRAGRARPAPTGTKFPC